MKKREINLKAFWKKNIALIAKLLTVWFVVSYGVVIILGDVLCDVGFFGCSLSFWFGQQGSILTFIFLLVIYAVKMDKMSEAFINIELEEALLQKKGA